MDKRKALVRSYKSTADAQKIFDDLCQDALHSTHSSIDSSRLLSYITYEAKAIILGLCKDPGK